MKKRRGQRLVVHVFEVVGDDVCEWIPQHVAFCDCEGWLEELVWPLALQVGIAGAAGQRGSSRPVDREGVVGLLLPCLDLSICVPIFNAGL